MTIARALLLSLLTALLSGCLVVPGAFTSAIDVRKNGTFTFRYVGQIVFVSPTEFTNPGRTAKWDDADAICINGLSLGKSEPTPLNQSKVPVSPTDAKATACTATQIAEQRKQWEERQVQQAKTNAEEAQKFGTLFGYTPGDDVANRRFAAALMKYDGWKTVTSKGNGVFDVVFEQAGRLDHDFIFPTMARGDVIFPFVMIRKQADGSARVSAPALVGGRAMASRFAALESKADTTSAAFTTKTTGTFTVTTDGEVRTNNTSDGPARSAGASRLVWSVDDETKVAPEALIALR